ncbi:hypothetical protein [Clostridium cellulovorans]|uniref:Uncharacterized protein n=1 Tax=Clostridium cellulovorans (strain ATCC 35296 / DSM 3052 / OCM 3 / 743B) TaxID=573061 RepID=D9SSY6_CLOC7|nr:hypothetical protein [Clostridium cellulovorans]ADL52648.1 hypothetical protein Clocel_2956 [Clostridium cellulovorans 743B]
MKNTNIYIIFKTENIILENLSIDFIRRIQKLKTGFSEEFEFPKAQWNSLRNKLPVTYNIYDTTLFKIAENLIVAKHLRHRTTDESLYDLIENNPSYRFYPKSFYYSKGGPYYESKRE